MNGPKPSAVSTLRRRPGRPLHANDIDTAVGDVDPAGLAVAADDGCDTAAARERRTAAVRT